MDSSRQLISAALESEERFRDALRRILGDFGMTVQELAHRSDVSPSTIYKIMNENRSPSLEVLRRIVSAIREKEGYRAGNFIAVIVTRQVLDEIVERSVRVGDETVKVREYPAMTVEDAIVAAVKAERDGAIAVVCAPIVSPTIEKILDIPIAAIVPRDSVTEAIRLAAKKSEA